MMCAVKLGQRAIDFIRRDSVVPSFTAGSEFWAPEARLFGVLQPILATFSLFLATVVLLRTVRRSI